MLKFAICDDNLDELRQTKILIEKYLDKRPELAVRLFPFSSPYEMLDETKESGGFDLYILDIIMPEISGIDLGKQLRENGDEGEIVYLSSSCDYAVDSYDAKAFFYLIKPVEEAKLFEVMDNAIKKLQEKTTQGITVHTHDGLCRVNFDDILYIEQIDRSIHYHLTDGNIVKTCTIRKPFSSEVEPILSDNRFIVCGSSFVLNLHRIKSISKNEAVFSCGVSLSLPRTLQRSMKQKWIEYWLERNEKNEI